MRRARPTTEVGIRILTMRRGAGARDDVAGTAEVREVDEVGVPGREPGAAAIGGAMGELASWAPGTIAAGTLPELAAATRAVSVSRFKRCRSVRISAAT